MDQVPPSQATDRRAAWAIGGAAGVVLAVLTAIVVFGYVPVPEFPRLADGPDASIPGQVAYVVGEQDRSCIMVVPAGGGQATEVACRRDGFEALGWTADGLIVASVFTDFRPVVGGGTILVYDPATGHEVASLVAGPSGTDRLHQVESERDSQGRRLEVPWTDDRRAKALIVTTSGEETTIVDVEGPRDYVFLGAQWSPDGEWIMLVDSRDRLLVLAADATPGPRVLADLHRDDGDRWSGTRPAWFIPGDATHTVEVDDLDPTA